MNFKWLGPVALLAALFIGDQIRINRPGHKYRLTIEVETPGGNKSAAGVMSVHPDRGYSRRGRTDTRGDAVFIDLGGGKNLVALMAHIDKTLDLDGINYVALRAYKAAGRNPSFNDMSRMTGAVPVTGALIPVLVSFADPGDPATMRNVAPDDLEATFGKGFRLHAVWAEVVPNGLWPLDFGGPLGAPVTRGIEAKLPWLKWSDASAVSALRAAGLPGGEAVDAKEAFTRK
jgi:hypothetical protein